jgi:hypothetical protein
MAFTYLTHALISEIFFYLNSQVMLLITNNAFCSEKRATAQSKTRMSRTYGLAVALLVLQAGWSDCMYVFYLTLLVSILA